MSDKYEHEIVDGTGATHPFSLTVQKQGAGGELVWPPETSKLEKVRRVSPSSITALIVWTTMKIRCWINAAAGAGGTELEIVFATTPYRYRIDDGGAFVTFLAGLALPNAVAEELETGEQPAPAGGDSAPDGEAADGPESNSCGRLVYVENRSPNQQYIWYFLINESDEFAGVTIRRSWIYDGKERSDTKRHDLYPGEEREVFSFPRNQNPRCTITHCKLG